MPMAARSPSAWPTSSLDERDRRTHRGHEARAATSSSPSATSVPGWTRRHATRIFEPFFTTKGRQGDRPRARDRLRHRPAERRDTSGSRGARARHDVPHLAARRRAPERIARRPSAPRGSGVGNRPRWSRTTSAVRRRGASAVEGPGFRLRCSLERRGGLARLPTRKRAAPIWC